MSKMIFKPLATPYQADIEFDYKELRGELDGFWKNNEKFFIDKYKIKAKTVKGGYSPAAQKMAEKRVGIAKLYSQYLVERCLNLIQEEEPDVFFAEDLDLVKFEEEGVHIRVKFYLYPELKFDKEELDHEVEDPVKEKLEDFIESRKREIQYQNRSLLDAEIVDENSRVLLDIVESKENSVKGIWYDFAEIPDTVRDALVGREKGEMFEVGDPVTIVKVHDVKEVVLPEFDDELAEISGFGSIEELEEISSKQFEAYKANTRLSSVVNHYIQELMLNSSYGPIPQVYLDRTVENMKKDHISHFQGDQERAFRAIGVKDDSELYNVFVGNIMRDIAQRLALNKYADMHGLDRADMQALQDHMMSSVVWV